MSILDLMSSKRTVIRHSYEGVFEQARPCLREIVDPGWELFRSKCIDIFVRSLFLRGLESRSIEIGHILAKGCGGLAVRFSGRAHNRERLLG